MDVRSLGPADREQLARFACAGPSSWSREIEETIRFELADAGRDGRLAVVGLFVGSQLAGVSAWTSSTLIRATSVERDPTRWTSNLIAVAHGHRGNGYGKYLKSHVIEVARDAGAQWLLSMVHEDNAAMIAINASLGGRFARDPVSDGYRQSPYLIFELRL